MGNRIEILPGVELYYEDKGAGDPIIFIPGWTFTTEIFEHNLDKLAETSRAIAYDPRSQGNSTVTELGNNYAQRGEDLANFINALDLKNVILAGWSLGAYDSYAYLAEYGTENIKAFVCIDMPPKGIKMAEDDWAEGTRDEIHDLISRIMQPDQRELIRDYTQFMITREVSEEEISWVLNQSLKTPANIANLLIADAALLDYSETARHLDTTIPVLHVIREDWSRVALQWLNKNIPSAKTAVLGGHMMFWEFPDQFNRAITDFLATV